MKQITSKDVMITAEQEFGDIQIFVLQLSLLCREGEACRKANLYSKH